MSKPSLASSRVLGFAQLPLLLLAAGCSPKHYAAKQAVAIAEAARPAFAAHWDYELGGQALAANIMQLEGLLRLRQGESLQLLLARAYVGYAYGWIEDQAEVAELRGDFSATSRLRQRAARMYRRAKHLVESALDLSDGDVQRWLESGAAPSAASRAQWLRGRFAGRRHAADLALWAQAWGGWLSTSAEDASGSAVLPYLLAIAEHSVALDAAADHAAALTFVGSLSASVPESAGGDLAKSKASFGRALDLTKGRALNVQVQMAATYAVATSNRGLYLKLLRKVIAQQQDPEELRMANRIAKRRARRYVDQVDLLL